MSSLRRIRLAYATNLLNIVPSLVLNLWLLRLIIRGSDDFEVGLYGQLAQVGLYLTTLQLGLDFAASQRIAAAIGRDDLDSAKRAYWQLRRFNRIIGFIILAIVLIGTAMAWSMLSVPGVSRETTVGLILSIGLTQVVAMFSRTASATIFGSEATHALNIITIGRTCTVIPLGYLLYKFGCGVTSLPIAELIALMIAAVGLNRLRNRYAPWSGSQVDRPMTGFRSLLRFGIGSAIGGIAWTIEAGCDVFLLDWVPGGGGLPEVAAYSVWWKFPMMAFTVCTGLAASAFPSFSKAFAESPDTAKRLLRKVGSNSLTIGLLAAIGIGLWLPAFIHLWMGGRFDRPTMPHLSLAIGTLITLRVCGNCIGLFWLATGHSTLTTVLSWIQVIVKIGLSCWLIPRYGMMGLLVSSCIAVSVQVIGVGIGMIRERYLSVRDSSVAILAVVLVVLGVAFEPRSWHEADLVSFGVGVSVTGILGLGVIKLVNRTVT